MTASPRNSPTGAPRPGRGLNAASEPSRPAPAAAAPGAAHPSPDGTWDSPGHPGRADHPSALPGFKPADDRPPVSAEGGLEGLSPALARARETAPSGDPGSSSRVGTREGNAGPGTRRPGPVTTSSPLRGGCGEAERGAGAAIPGASSPATGTSSPALQGHAGEANSPAGGARSNAAPPAAEEFRRKWQAALSSKAAAKRGDRGRRRASSAGDRYVPGGARRMPGADR